MELPPARTAARARARPREHERRLRAVADALPRRLPGQVRRLLHAAPAEGRWIVVTSDPATIKEVFTGDPNLLHAGAGNIVLQPILGSRSVLLLDGAEHLRQRRLMLPSFHGERMRPTRDVMRAAAERAIAAWPRGRPLRRAAQHAGDHPRGDPARGVRHHRARAPRAVGAPLRGVLDTVASRRRVLSLALDRWAHRAAEPVGALRRGARGAPTSCCTRRSQARASRSRRARRRAVAAARGARRGRPARCPTRSCATS